MAQHTSPAILLTGPPGVGKTTAVKAVVTLLGGRAGGFYTRELRHRGSRTGFEIVTLDGRSAWPAALRCPHSAPRRSLAHTGST